MDGVSESLSVGPMDKVGHIKALNKKIKLAFEKDVLGLYLSGHPLEEHKKLVEALMSMNLADLKEASKNDAFSRKNDNKNFIIAGMIVHKKNMTTKTGKIMSFIQVEDLYDVLEVIVFPKVYDRFIHLLKEDQFVIVSGRLNFKEEEDPKLLADSIMVLNEENSRSIISSNSKKDQIKKPKQVKLFLKLATHNEQVIHHILQELKVSPGKMPVVLYFADTKKENDSTETFVGKQ